MTLDHFQGFDRSDTGWCDSARRDPDVKKRSVKTAISTPWIHMKLNPTGALRMLDFSKRTGFSFVGTNTTRGGRLRQQEWKENRLYFKKCDSWCNQQRAAEHNFLPAGSCLEKKGGLHFEIFDSFSGSKSMNQFVSAHGHWGDIRGYLLSTIHLQIPHYLLRIKMMFDKVDL